MYNVREGNVFMLYTGKVIETKRVERTHSGTKSSVHLRKKDAVELIKTDMSDYTDLPYLVEITSDDGGTMIQITVEDHENSSKILRDFSSQYQGHRLVVLKVPEGYLQGMEE